MVTCIILDIILVYKFHLNTECQIIKTLFSNKSNELHKKINILNNIKRYSNNAQNENDHKYDEYTKINTQIIYLSGAIDDFKEGSEIKKHIDDIDNDFKRYNEIYNKYMDIVQKINIICRIGKYLLYFLNTIKIEKQRTVDDHKNDINILNKYLENYKINERKHKRKYNILNVVDRLKQNLKNLQEKAEVDLKNIEAEITKLPIRQREAFLMRYWDELSTAETALAMGCSEGSVKTHCSRATHTLAAALKAKGIVL
jgi:RNA polymerase sigma factor (sigma-70 family)